MKQRYTMHIYDMEKILHKFSTEFPYLSYESENFKLYKHTDHYVATLRFLGDKSLYFYSDKEFVDFLESVTHVRFGRTEFDSWAQSVSWYYEQFSEKKDKPLIQEFFSRFLCLGECGTWTVDLENGYLMCSDDVFGTIKGIMIRPCGSIEYKEKF